MHKASSEGYWDAQKKNSLAAFLVANPDWCCTHKHTCRPKPKRLASSITH